MEEKHQQLHQLPFWEQDEISLAVSYPPLVPSSSSLATAEQGNLEENYLQIGGYRISHAYLLKVEWVMANTGSLCFLIGSYYFLPGESNFVDSAAILFVTGSVTFTIASVILFLRNRGHTCVDMPLTYNGLLYIGANILFIVGCVCFMPQYADEDVATLDTGITLFTLGSLVFTFAPIWNILRTIELREQKLLHISSFYTELCIGGAYIIGSALFVVGSILFLPTYYSQNAEEAVGCFISGSAFFLLATIITSIVSLFRKLTRLLMTGDMRGGSKSSGEKPHDDVQTSGGLKDAVLPNNVSRSN